MEHVEKRKSNEESQISADGRYSCEKVQKNVLLFDANFRGQVEKEQVLEVIVGISYPSNCDAKVRNFARVRTSMFVNVLVNAEIFRTL